MKHTKYFKLEELSVDMFERVEATNLGKSYMIPLGGLGNMFGGSGKGIIIDVSGGSNIHAELGQIRIRGEYTYGYNIRRGANGPMSGTASFGEISVTVQGKCNAEAALGAVLSIEKGWIKKEYLEYVKRLVDVYLEKEAA